jgi:hypothetical protein
MLKESRIQDCRPYVELISFDHHLQASFTRPSIRVCLLPARLGSLRACRVEACYGHVFSTSYFGFSPEPDF